MDQLRFSNIVMNNQLCEFRLIVFAELGVLSHKGHLNTDNHYIVYDDHPNGRVILQHSLMTSVLFVNKDDTILQERAPESQDL